MPKYLFTIIMAIPMKIGYFQIFPENATVGLPKSGTLPMTLGLWSHFVEKHDA